MDDSAMREEGEGKRDLRCEQRGFRASRDRAREKGGTVLQYKFRSGSAMDSQQRDAKNGKNEDTYGRWVLK